MSSLLLYFLFSRNNHKTFVIIIIIGKTSEKIRDVFLSFPI